MRGADVELAACELDALVGGVQPDVELASRAHEFLLAEAAAVVLDPTADPTVAGRDRDHNSSGVGVLLGVDQELADSAVDQPLGLGRIPGPRRLDIDLERRFGCDLPAERAE